MKLATPCGACISVLCDSIRISHFHRGKAQGEALKKVVFGSKTSSDGAQPCRSPGEQKR